MAATKGKRKVEALARLPVIYNSEAVAVSFSTDRELFLAAAVEKFQCLSGTDRATVCFLDVVCSAQLTAANTKVVIKNKNHVLFYLFQRRGIVAEKVCIRCRPRGGQFVQCVVSLSANGRVLYYGACANCLVGGHGRQCSLCTDFEEAGGTNLTVEECGDFLFQGGLLACSFAEYNALEAGDVDLEITGARTRSLSVEIDFKSSVAFFQSSSVYGQERKASVSVFFLCLSCPYSFVFSVDSPRLFGGKGPVVSALLPNSLAAISSGTTSLLMDMRDLADQISGLHNSATQVLESVKRLRTDYRQLCTDLQVVGDVVSRPRVPSAVVSVAGIFSKFRMSTSAAASSSAKDISIAAALFFFSAKSFPARALGSAATVRFRGLSIGSASGAGIARKRLFSVGAAAASSSAAPVGLDDPEGDSNVVINIAPRKRKKN
ncbi:hypothetical protein BDV40DRAFT_297414 [Aspergillus tamarii]|uniref:Uncharacterized protein n=1 Tax=Aspergillus tamarii TaxID=41984 RepID=A0A5N6V342_ASPTM|nr:hypothetical protein BDV40DRAFT_297414 [Aspergillus tamarii]